MQHLHSFRNIFESIRDCRLIAFAGESPAESQSLPANNSEIQPVPSPTEMRLRHEQSLQKRSERNRREAWERSCEQMTDEQLLQTLGELHVKSVDGWYKFQKTHPTRESKLYEKLDRQVQLIEEQLDGARRVWADRRHGKQTVQQWTKDMSSLSEQQAAARMHFERLPTTDPKLQVERLKLAIIEEQVDVVMGAQRMVEFNAKRR